MLTKLTMESMKQYCHIPKLNYIAPQDQNPGARVEMGKEVVTKTARNPSLYEVYLSTYRCMSLSLLTKYLSFLFILTLYSMVKYGY